MTPTKTIDVASAPESGGWVATGKITDRCYDQHTNAEFLDFLKLVARTHPRVKLRVVCDNYATTSTPT